MKRTQIDTLIINSPYEKPSEFWKYDPKTRLFERVAGRRPAVTSSPPPVRIL
jgi:hypothetical protein